MPLLPHPLPRLPLLPFLLLLLFLSQTPLLRAECEVHLPVATATSPSPSPPASPSPASPQPVSARILAGRKPALSDFDNIVAIAVETVSGKDIHCLGSLIASDWVITAAQCFITQRESVVLYGGTTSDNGRENSIVFTKHHPGWDAASVTDFPRNDIQLIKLSKRVFGAASPDSPGSQPPSDPRQPSPSPSPGSSPEPEYNVMRLNTNPAFAMKESDPRFLRVKGYGLSTRPETNQQALVGEARELKFADLLTASCDDRVGNDEGRRLCTEKRQDCGPCYGDTGAPLYDVDKSGKVSVLVGIVTFGRFGVSQREATEICTSKRRPVIYTAIAPYVPWIRETVGNDTQLFEFFIPPEGITDTDLAPNDGSFPIAARVSIIVIACLTLIAVIGFIIFTCVVRTLRRRRRRWVEGLNAEESFVKGKERDANIVDPFEGIVGDQKSARLSMSSLGRAAVKGATEFSSRSIGAVRAMLLRLEEEDDMFLEAREPMEDAPQWLPNAWEKLFNPPSKKDLSYIHKVPTQRVVDDVLEGGDRSYEPSLENVAYKSARDEANMEAAWKKLEIQTSLRNLSEASGSQHDVMQSPTTPGGSLPSRSASGIIPLSFSSRNPSSRALRKQGSRGGSPLVPSSPLASRDGIANFAKADTLLAAFASIDAESEQVAEETVIDSSALRALAMAKKPNVLATLRRKFSNPSNSNPRNLSRGNSDREVIGEGMIDTRPRSGKRNGNSNSSHAAAPAGASPVGSPVAHRGSRTGSQSSVQPGGLLSAVQILSSSARSSARGMSTGSISGLSSNSITPAVSRHDSMRVDYFSEDYSLSDSSSDDGIGPVMFEDSPIPSGRRYTEDRRPEGESAVSGGGRGFRKGPTRSFESFDSIRSGSDDDEIQPNTGRLESSMDDVHPNVLSMADAQMEIIEPEGCETVKMEKNTVGRGVGAAAGVSSKLEIHTRTELSLSTMSSNPFDNSVMDSTSASSRAGNSSMAGNRRVVGSASMSRRAGNSSVIVNRSVAEREDCTDSTGCEIRQTDGSMGRVPERLKSEAVGEEDKEEEREDRPESEVRFEVAGEARVDGVNRISVAKLKEMWNEMVRRDSSSGGSLGSRGSVSSFGL